ncbi:MAG: restriction endonuclease [Solirubrobacteraceae bacterium]
MTSADQLDQLHDRLFAERPNKKGDRFERITALVFAALGEGQARWQVHRGGAGRRAKHRIDVEVERDAGCHRLVVECKHWDEKVGQDVANSVASRRDQLGANEAAIVSTRGFTSGAQDVAAGEGIRLVLVKPLAEDDDWRGVVKRIVMHGTFIAPEIRDFTWLAYAPEDAGRGGPIDPAVLATIDSPEDQLDVLGLDHEDGSRAERLGELLALRSSVPESGEHEQEVVFEEFGISGPRYVTGHRDRVRIRGLRWTERVAVAKSSFTVNPPSPGLLWIEEIVAGADPARRVLMDHQLRPWRFDENGVLMPAPADDAPNG